ncbi:MAG: hypothetical protein LWW85_03905, partial [Marinilabiliales bacterium]|nr:hypothetical protein [Marinilabiliales bacterium]
KTEVHISRHLYLSKHEQGFNAFSMHGFLILNNLVIGLLPALLGVVFFFVPKLKVSTDTYGRVAAYYLRVCRTGNWMSERSVNSSPEMGRTNAAYSN